MLIHFPRFLSVIIDFNQITGLSFSMWDGVIVGTDTNRHTTTPLPTLNVLHFRFCAS
jgi:hypothetical protein